jgi:hypothetical protein
MEKRATYKGYAIQAAPNKLADGTWDTNFHIGRYTGDAHSSKNFTSASTFQTEEESVRHCFY